MRFDLIDLRRRRGSSRARACRSRMVEQGAGIGIVPATAARRYRGTPRLRTIELRDPWATRRLLICMRELNALPRAEKALVRHLAGI
ncbi:LysR substrate-binding domain-containing protein [Paraburkholderia sp. BR14320]|uniref:LysR substrate-binding domain-containing protein n=1 Tax=unclassified Paraburkholderia TaxID=2615204 RepID=UPI0034CDC695